MPFGLKNVRVTYQRATNLIFHDLIGRNIEVYIDDVVVRLPNFDKHLSDMEQAIKRIRAHELKKESKGMHFSNNDKSFPRILSPSKRV